MSQFVRRSSFVAGVPANDEGPEPDSAPELDLHEPAEVAELPLPSRDSAEAVALAPPHASAGERLMRFAYRLGVPGSTIARPFGRSAKLRLLATVESPLAGDRVAGMAVRAGHFLVHGAKMPIAQTNFASTGRLTAPFQRTVHGFSWLRDLSACAPAAQCAPTAERVLSAWLAANPSPGVGPAWKPGLVGRRLLAWLVHAPLILSGGDKGLRARAMFAIEDTARWLDRMPGKADDRLEEVAAWCAVVAAGLLLTDGKPRRLHGEAGLAQALGELVGAEGGVLSRSPLAQMEAIELLVELCACYRALRQEPPEQLGAMLQMLVPPLLGLTHADGGLGSWQGACPIPEERVQALLSASGVRARPLADARQWGYQRLTGGASVLQFDAAPPPLARHARMGCASTLAFEFSHGPHRLVVNCGGAATAGGQVPARIEQGLRASAAHSTLVIGDANSTAVVIGGKLGAGVSEVEVDRRRAEGRPPAATIAASHNGYVARYGLLHHRALTLQDDGRVLRGEDELVPHGRKAGRGKLGYALRFHLGPEVSVKVAEDGHAARLDLPDGTCWMFVAEGGTVELDESLWVDGDGLPHGTQQLVVQGIISRGGDSFAWRFEKLGAGMR